MKIKRRAVFAGSIAVAMGLASLASTTLPQAQAVGGPVREYFSDTFGDPLDYSNTEDVALAVMPIDRRSCSYENGVVGWADVVSLWRLEPVTSLTREPWALCSVAMSTYLSFF